MAFLPWNKQRTVYLDYAAATPLSREADLASRPYTTQWFSNASALYGGGVRSKRAIEAARGVVAGIFSAEPDTIVFTSGGTEANNTALFGVARANRTHGNHIIASKFEHSSVLEPLKKLAEEGFEIEYVATVEEAIKAIRKETILVTWMYVNNEVGTVYDISGLGREILKWRKENGTIYPYFHSDACQAVNYCDLDVRRLHTDLVTINGGKIYGPKGIGALYIARGVITEPLVYGGGQEKGKRSGTENVSGVVGFAVAALSAHRRQEEECVRLKKLQSFFWHELQKRVPKVELNGETLESGDRVCNNLNVCIPQIEGEKLVLYLDARGISASLGSACSSNTNETSHVLEALGYTKERAERSIRFTLGRETKKRDIRYTVKALGEIVASFS